MFFNCVLPAAAAALPAERSRGCDPTRPALQAPLPGGCEDPTTPGSRTQTLTCVWLVGGGLRGEQVSFPPRAAVLRCTLFPRTAPPAPPLPLHFITAARTEPTRGCAAVGSVRMNKTGPEGKPARWKRNGNPETGLYRASQMTRVQGADGPLLGEACRRHPVGTAVLLRELENAFPAQASGTIPHPLPHHPHPPSGPGGVSE